MTIKSEKNFVSSLPLNTSRTTARERTTPAAAVKPYKKRAAINIVMFGANAQRRDDGKDR
ncbi:hypothetical protein J2Z83_002178 [Virgibacillus natechei]|uniref:Uncharacterized protein n=1 Tax=Virgibacillus natechei TaxID=1216297 RepID=A0ABS4IGJ7_9BACI|nr:hypothetical protein [Virgibacillus natechei]